MCCHSLRTKQRDWISERINVCVCVYLFVLTHLCMCERAKERKYQLLWQWWFHLVASDKQKPNWMLSKLLTCYEVAEWYKCIHTIKEMIEMNCKGKRHGNLQQPQEIHYKHNRMNLINATITFRFEISEQLKTCLILFALLGDLLIMTN